VDTVALDEDIGGHCRIPFAFEVAEVAACFKELIEIKRCHNVSGGVFWVVYVLGDF
jgi:hypothetical protein